MWWSVRTAAPSRNLLPVRLTTLTDATTLDDSGLSTPQVESTDGFMVSKALVGDDKIEALRGQTVSSCPALNTPPSVMHHAMSAFEFQSAGVGLNQAFRLICDGWLAKWAFIILNSL